MFRLLAPLVLSAVPAAQIPSFQVNEHYGGFTGDLSAFDEFARGLCPLGDLDGDGVEDLAVGAPRDHGNGFQQGAVWILLRDPDGSIRTSRRIGEGDSDFPGLLSDDAEFGHDVSALGDLDGDGVTELAVAGPNMITHASWWILFLRDDGTVKAAVEHPTRVWSVAGLGDLDGDGVGDVALGTAGVTIAFLNADGTIKSTTAFELEPDIAFGRAVANLGDVDGDGVVDLGIGAPLDNYGCCCCIGHFGSTFTALLNADGSVKSWNKVLPLVLSPFGMTPAPGPVDMYGISVTGLGDWDGDGVRDMAAGMLDDQDPVWLLFLNSDGSLRDSESIEDVQGGFGPPIVNGDRFGGSLALLGDLDGDGTRGLAVGDWGDDDSGTNSGSFWVLFDGEPAATVTPFGCGTNPAGSLSVISGAPALNTQLVVGVDNPLGTQGPGSVPVVALALNPAPAFPCGALVAGWGMGGPGALGELLLPLPVDPNLIAVGPPWAGPESPSPVSLLVPFAAGQVGLSVYVQGALVDPIGAGGVVFGLTNGLELWIGP